MRLTDHFAEAAGNVFGIGAVDIQPFPVDPQNIADAPVQLRPPLIIRPSKSAFKPFPISAPTPSILPRSTPDNVHPSPFSTSHHYLDTTESFYEYRFQM
jgi:hypothetical protein